MLKIFFKTGLSSSLGAANYYFIGIGALVIILVVAAAAIFLSPDLQKNLNISQEQQLEKSKVAGKIVDINYDEEYFVIDDEDSGELFKVSLPEGTQINAGGIGGGTYTLSDLETGQYIELTNVKYTSSGGGGSNKKSGGSNNNGGGSNNNGGGDNNQNEVDDWDDIYVYFPFPAFSAKITSIDADSNTIQVETTVKGSKTFEIIIGSETLISSVDPNYVKNVVKFSELGVGWEVDVFSEEDPTVSTTLDAILLLITKKS